MFENVVSKIFENAGYSVNQDGQLQHQLEYADIIAEKENRRYCIEVKYLQLRERAVDRICSMGKTHGMTPVAVVGSKIDDIRRNHYLEKYPDLILLDIANLLFAVQSYTELRNELIAALPFSIEEIEPQEGFLQIDILQHDDYTNSLIEEMNLCKAGGPLARTYEVLCHKLLENAFSEDLALWKEQQKSNNELYRFDLLCRIKDENQKTFWSILERYFKSKYVIFEFKNYNKPITQKEIYTTEKYLYAKALRSVGIIIAAHGYDENAYWAAKGCLRENGKLIILLDTDDLIEMNKVNFAKDDPSTITSYQVYFSLYQQLAGNNDDQEEENENALAKLSQLFRPDFFDLIIVDECHRGSAKKESNWRKILEYFSSATQIGMTATPKETKYISNIDYFGEPIYTYSLKEGIEDGFLAPFKVINIMTDIGEGWRPRKGQRDIYGNEIEDRIYTNSDYDYTIIIQDRIEQVAAEITRYLKSTDRMAKTIVFCATEDAAERMRVALVNQNADMVKQNPDYVVRITGSDTYGKSKLDYFISVSAKYPVIATTSKLLSTGSDCKMTKLIVLDEMIGSMTEFKQIIGRGTRLREKEGKTHFVVMDFRNVSRLFADPEWDGPIEMNDDYDPNKDTPQTPPKPSPDTPNPPVGPKNPKPIVDKNGCRVEVIYKTVSVYDASGKLLKQESIIDYTKENIRGAYASLDNFIRQWSAEDKKETIRELLRNQGIDLEAIKADQGMSDVDDFDFICHVAFDKKPLTRRERAENVKKKDFLNKYSGAARTVLEALLDKYMNTGIYEIEKTEILRLDPFMQMGKPQKIASYFGGKDGYLKAVKELEQAIYEGGAA